MKESFRTGKDLDFNDDPYGVLSREFINESPGVEWVEIQTQHTMDCTCKSCGHQTDRTWTPTITTGKRITLVAYEPSYSCYNCGTLFLDPYGRMESIERAIDLFRQEQDIATVPLLEEALGTLLFQMHTVKKDKPQ